MNINDMYQICQYAINKAQNGYLTPSQFNLLANQAQTSYQDYLLGEFQQYQIGRPQARVNYSQNSDTRQRMAPFLKDVTLTINADGIALYPDDYLQGDAVLTSTFDRIRFIQQDSLYSYLKSEIDPIATNPVYLLANVNSTYTDGGLQFYPKTLGTAILSYVMNAPTMIWGYNLDSNGRPVYNPNPYDPSTQPTGSVQPLWYDIDKLEIVARILKLVGVNLQDGQVAQYANMVTTQGQ